MQQVTTNAYRQDALWRYIITGCGLALIVLTLSIGAFLCYKGVGTFTTYNHSIREFLFSADWAPSDSAEGGGKVGAAIFIFGSVITCALALQRFRFKPATDGQGNPVASTYGWRQRWYE